ncbi:hypothetical protein MBAV_000931 [Candidatus Magnetobacterium bavaricum]|uniref:BACON domain-containing protein n=1 Tax=Candidatus Magnetobacterium bavaricum TaxID=29290 RepID=A0A0F3GYC8_9BACT|nr:hypothetical protein MBAV_000931 [Candidatus Magnetobacterium bavaricum]
MANTGCTWTASSNVGWITISSGSSGSGNGSVGYTVAANTATSSRTGTMTIAGQSFTVTQAAATPTCTSYTISPTSNNFTSNGGAGSVSVTANTGCAWTASSSQGWIVVTSGSSGSGNGTVAYNVAQNTATSPRTGTMTIAGQTFTVTQAAATACVSTITPTSKQFLAAGGSGSVNISTTSDCKWTATGNDNWITITSNSSGSGNATVNYAVAENTSAARTGTMTIAGQTFTVTQSGPDCATGMSISPTSKNFASNGGSDTVSVTTPGGSCQWGATSNAAWISITSGDAGTGSGKVSYAVSANTATSKRTGTMTIAGQTFTVTQDAQLGKVHLTVEIKGSGSVSVSSGTLDWNSDGTTGIGSYDKDTMVILTAEASLGSTIKGWTGCDQNVGSGQCMVTLDVDKTVTVEFRLPRTSEYDFNGDGNSDVLWRDADTGDIFIWLMNGKSIKSDSNYIARNVGTDWDIKAAGDFNGDGRADLLWQDKVSGDVYVYIMDGTNKIDEGYAVKGMPKEWEVKAIGDFNGDGKADIMWRDSNLGDVYVWLMNGKTIAPYGDGGSGYLSRGMLGSWEIKVIADLNGDKKSDVVWQNNETGDIFVWLMDGLTKLEQDYVAKGIPVSWQIKTVADFNGDGKADILWNETQSNDYALWLMNGLEISGGGYVAKAMPSAWQVVKTGDYNGDGKADIVWKNSTNGDVYLFLMDGTKKASEGYIAQGMPNNWETR